MSWIFSGLRDVSQFEGSEMSEFAGTRGPWEWIIDGDAVRYELRSVGGSMVDSHPSPRFSRPTPDMRLMQASPELLAACQSIIDFDVENDGARDLRGIIAEARAAIAKALGQASGGE